MDKISAYTNTADASDEFTEGNPSTGTPATEVDGGWLNAVQRELVAIIQSMGLTLSDADDTLAWQAIEKIYGRTFAGDPNGNVAADVVRERCWDTSAGLPVLYISTAADGTVGGTTWERFENTIDSSKVIGEVFALQDDIPGVSPPSNAGAAKYIKLTAGEDGAGQYNEGLLINENVSGSSPTVSATAEISHAGSPLDGQTVRLINTEERFLRAGNAGETQDGQIEEHNHSGSTSTAGNHRHGATSGQSTGGGSFDEGDSAGATIHTDYAGNHSHSLNIDNAGGDETRPRNIGTTYYMRIA